MRTRDRNGFTLIELLLVVTVIGIISAIAVPGLLSAKQSADSASAIGSMRTISSAQISYALTCDGGYYAPNLTTLGLVPPGSNAPFISPDLASANTVTKSGYAITLSGAAFAGAPASCNGLPAGQAGRGYKSTADPTEPNNRRFFATNTDSTVYEHDSTLTLVMPEVGDPPVGHALQ